MGFAIVGNMAIAFASFPMVSLLSLLHGVDPTFGESIRLTEAAHIAVYFSFVPFAALLLVRCIPTTPLPPSPPDPFYDDAASTIRFMAALVIGGCPAVSIVLRFAGMGTGDGAGAMIQTIYYSMVIIYTILLADCRKPAAAARIWDMAVALSLAVMCIVFVKREILLLALPLLVQQRNRVRPIWIIGLFGAGAAIIFVNMVVRGDLDLAATVIRVLGNQFKYLERYSLNFGMYDQCFGLSTIMAFTNPARYQAFYNLTFDPISFAAGGTSFRWDSSNLLERLNYAYCSVEISFLLYFIFLSVLLLLAKKLGDVRYFRVALVTVMGAYTGFAFFNIPLVLGLALLLLSGFWRIGRAMLAPCPVNKIVPKGVNPGGV